MKAFLITFLLVLTFYVETSANSDIYFHKMSIEDGLSQLSVRTIYQDEFGDLWFGTREGINKFNGNSFEVIYPTFDDKNASQESLIYNICGDKKGLVFIHSQSGVIKYNLKNATFSTVTQNNVNHITYGIHNLWIAERKCIYTYDKDKKNKYVELETAKSSISCVFQASDMRIYAGTISSGVFVIDQNKNVKTIIKDCSEVTCFYEDNKKNIWIATLNSGVYKIERTGNIKHYTTNTISQETTICSDYARTICQDNNGFIWIGTYKGLNKLNPETEQFTYYGSEKSSELFLSNESIWSLLKDNQGTIWVGTYFGGINYFNPDVNFYTFHDLQKGVLRNKPFPVISNIVEHDNNQSIFLCSEGCGLIYYNLMDKSYKVFLANDNDPNSIIANNIKAAYFDSEKEELWIGTHLRGVCVLNTQKWTFTKYPPIKPTWQNANNVHAIIPYKDDLLVATQNGLFILNKKKKTFTLFSNKLHKLTQVIHDIKIDKKQNLWIASINGLYKYNLESRNIRSYFYNVDIPTSLSHNNTVKILIDSKNRVWIATNGGGVNLYNDDTDDFIRYNKSQSGLINNYVSNLRESFLGKIIITTTKGLAVLDVEKNKLFNFSKSNGFPLNSLFSGGVNISHNGEVFIAGMNGMVSFFEETLTLQPKKFKLHFVNLWINNNLVTLNDQTGILDKSMPYTNKIHLNAKQKIVSLEFASNNYIQGDRVLYRYKLQGFSDSWIELQSNNKINFMNLSPGKYNLIVEGVLRDDLSLIDSISLQIIISSPIYKTWYAYLFYVILISFITWRFIAFNRSKLLLKTSLDYEKKEKEHLENVNQSKLRFFTNISHEFRTPLTLIRGHVDMLLQTHNISPVIYNSILNIKRNTINMQNLINELLEFRKSELGHLQIKVSEHDIIGFINEIYLSFSEYANYMQITFEYEHQDNHIEIWFDAVQLQKVFYNLISNAFKYTPKGGEIKILVEQENENVIIKIFDSGIGISSAEINKIFDRFYQAENGIQINNSSGTGIGLALVKNILKEHSAEIQVSSELNSGSCFIVTLKKGLSHFTEEQIINATHYDADITCIEQISELDQSFIQELVQIRIDKKNNPQYSILIVEDNAELRAMLKNIFEPLYKVYVANDGEEGLALTMKHMPDIVLTDLMMPKMSGIEMCSKIKSNFSICHIPVILLTAQTALEANIESLMLGADDYIIKPFDVKILISRCNNLVNNRKMLQDKFSKSETLPIKQLATNDLDRIFLEKAYDVINKFIEDADFDISTFSSEMALSRTNLFRKIKGVTGQTPNKFINTIRLHKSAELLSFHPEYSISEISYKVGFTSPKYFGKCFKDHYGMSPKDYRIKKNDFNKKV